MKINIFNASIAIAVSSVIAFDMYNFNESENRLLLSAGSFAFLSVTLNNLIGIWTGHSRTTKNIKIVSCIFFAIAMISSLIFTFFSFSIPFYVCINGILLLVFILATYSINSSKQ